jgi:alanine-glyoxylate transaminase/serine-glyoxylate transaminase/serine-pyruvate transaminase
MPIMMDNVGIDIAYSCTQKGLSCPPGLAPLAVSERALDWLRGRKTPVDNFYMDLRLLLDYYDAPHRYHHTAPITLFYGLREGLRLIAEEGLEARWKRHLKSHLAFVAGVEAMGLNMHAADGHRIWNLNTPRVPEGIDDAKVRRKLLSERGIEILGGFGPLAGKILRIGIMGPLATEENVTMLLEALQEALVAEGYRPGNSAAEAAKQVFA